MAEDDRPEQKTCEKLANHLGLLQPASERPECSRRREQRRELEQKRKELMLAETAYWDSGP